MRKKVVQYSFTLLFFVVLSVSVFAQQGGAPDFEKIKSEKISFFTKELSLTPKEAEKFWPVYNEYEKKRFELMGKRREYETKLGAELNSISQKECADLSRKIAASYLEEGKLTYDYNDKFLNILPAKKVVQLYNVELQFRHMLLRNYRDKGPDKEKK